jgi:hypothetical protein
LLRLHVCQNTVQIFRETASFEASG